MDDEIPTSNPTQEAPGSEVSEIETGSSTEIPEGGAESSLDGASDTTTADNNGGGSISLDDLSDDKDEAIAQLAEMDHETQRKYMDMLEAKGLEGFEKPAEEVQEETPEESQLVEAPMGIDQGVYDAFTDEQREQVNVIGSKMAEMDAIDINEFRAGLQKLENDPMIKARMEQLRGNGVIMNDKQIQASMSREAIEGLGLDFRLHPEKSLAKIQNHLQNTVHNAISSVVDTYEAGNRQRENNAILDRELDIVRNTYEGMGSELPYSSAEHPMADFMAWLSKNSGGINIRSIGGSVAYEAYLNATGKSKGIVANAVARGQQDMADKLRKADRKVATLPRNSNITKPNARNVDGIDVKRLKSDADYTDKLLEKHYNNPKMRNKIERLLIS